MRILITGGTGFLGRFLIKQLKEKNEIYAITKSNNNIFDENQITWIEKDISKISIEDLPRDIECVIHLAQSKEYKFFPEKALDIFDVNCNSTLRLLDYSRELGVKKFIYSSTGSVYVPKKTEYFEEDLVASRDFYSLSKYISEKLIMSYSSFFNILILRFFFIYGPSQDKMLIPNLINSIKLGKSIFLDGYNGIRLTPIFVEDAVKAIQKCIKIEGNHIINIAGTETTSIREISETIGDIIGKKPLFEYNEVSTEINYIANTEKMKDLLSIDKTITIREGLKRTIFNENLNK